MGQDLYKTLLGIKAKERPVDHYTLLGLERFVWDPRAVERQALAQMGKVRPYQNHPQREQRAAVHELMSQIASACVDLLDVKRKARYDAALAKRLGVAPPPPPTDAVSVAAAGAAEVDIDDLLLKIAPLDETTGEVVRFAPTSLPVTVADSGRRPLAVFDRLLLPTGWLIKAGLALGVAWLVLSMGPRVEWLVWQESEMRRVWTESRIKTTGKYTRHDPELAERNCWARIPRLGKRHRRFALQWYLEQVPEGPHAAEARALLAETGGSGYVLVLGAAGLLAGATVIQAVRRRLAA